MDNVIPINLYNTHFVMSRISGLLLTREGQFTRHHFQAARMSKTRAEDVQKQIQDVAAIPVNDYMMGAGC